MDLYRFAALLDRGGGILEALDGGVGPQDAPEGELRDLWTRALGAYPAANRAGYVTGCSQPGHDPQTGFDGWQWQQLAAVSGFCDEATAASLHTAVTPSTGLVVYAWPPGEKRRSDLFDVPATIRQDPATGDVWVNTVFGPPLSRRDLRAIYRGDLPRPAIKALQSAWQVTLFDPEYGRNDRLWPLLAQWAASGTGLDTDVSGRAMPWDALDQALPSPTTNRKSHRDS